MPKEMFIVYIDNEQKGLRAASYIPNLSFKVIILLLLLAYSHGSFRLLILEPFLTEHNSTSSLASQHKSMMKRLFSKSGYLNVEKWLFRGNVILKSPTMNVLQEYVGFKRTPVLGNFQAISKSRHWQRKNFFRPGN